MTYEEQLQRWVDGDSWHKGDKEGEKSTCCPDFSCCVPELQSPKEERELFQQLYLAGKHAESERMLMMFLLRSLSVLAPGKKVYLAGGKE
jgi:hypothetical protein